LRRWGRAYPGKTGNIVAGVGALRKFGIGLIRTCKGNIRAAIDRMEMES